MRGGFWFTLYDALLPLVHLAAIVVSWFNPRLKKALNSRNSSVNSCKFSDSDDRATVLIHTSSRGELEGALPLIEKLSASGKVRIALTYSSPSVEKSAGSIDAVWMHCYLPLDYFQQQITFLGRLEPSVVLIFKHDFWPNMLRAADAFGIPVVLVNANFHAKTKRTLPIVRSFNRRFMRSIAAIWTVSDRDAERIEPLLSVATELEALGDTRYDRVRQRAVDGESQFKSLRDALDSSCVIVLGSSWQRGEQIGWEAFAKIKGDYPDVELIVAPHEPNDDALSRNEALAEQYGLKAVRLSTWEGGKIDADVLIVDRMGVLAGLYSVGWAAYVGGGFGVGVHSVIEPAAHAIPVMFGPNHHVSHEASLLIEAGGGFVVESASEMERMWRKWLTEPDSYRLAADAADSVVRSREGVTDRVIEKLARYVDADS